MMKRNEKIITINNVDFYYVCDNQTTQDILIRTDSENYHIPFGSDLEKECEKIYKMHYEN